MITKHVDKFDKAWRDLWSYLKKIPSVAKTERAALNRAFTKYRDMDREQYMSYTLNNMLPGIDLISRNDEFVMTPEFNPKPIFYFIGYDFKKLWRAGLSKDQQKVIFRYLQLMFIQAGLALNKHREKVEQIVEAIREQDSIQAEAEANPNAFDEEGGLDFQSLFNGDGLLTELAGDLTSELDLGQTLKDLIAEGNIEPGANPMETAMKLAQNPKIAEAITNLQTKVGKKLQDRNVTQDDLMKSADTLKQNLAKNLGKNMPGGSKQFQRMMENFDVSKLMSQGGGGGGGIPPQFQQMMSQMMSQMPTPPQSPQSSTSPSPTTPQVPPNLNEMIENIRKTWDQNPQLRENFQKVLAPTQPTPSPTQTPSPAQTPSPTQTPSPDQTPAKASEVTPKETTPTSTDNNTPDVD